MNMFSARVCKRNKLSFVRMIAVLISLCVIVLLVRNIGTSNIVEEYRTETIEELENTLYRETSRTNHIVPMKKGTTTLTNQPDPVELNHLAKLDTYSSVAELRDIVKRLNYEQRILNIDHFPTRSKESIVIVVQVHKRVNYLIKLIESLRKAKGISDALLVISHDYYASEINNIVRGIDFCQVIQIFFPYSPQLHPNKFPGADPNDCPRDSSKTYAHSIGCNNAEHPDMYGHYREVKFVMTKHHWWWKANRVFRELHSTKNHQGLILLLEEDHYVSPDFYEVLKKAYRLKQKDSKCSEYGCDIITLGDYKTVQSFKDVGSHVLRIQPWRSTENNMGMALDQATWRKLVKCHKVFCTYDDYNWDWTLMRMSLRCLTKPLTVLLFVAPRVFHLGTCGLHHQDTNCNIHSVVAQVQKVIDRSEGVLDPESFQVEISTPWVQGHFGQANGGWGDIRDHELCLNFTKSTD